MTEKKLRRIFNVIMLALLILSLVTVLTVSALAAAFDNDSFIKIGFFLYLLIFLLYAAPIAMALEAVLIIIKEVMVYKKFNVGKKRATLCVISAVLFIASGVCIPLMFGLSMLDRLMLPALILLGAGVALFTVGITRDN